MSDEIVFERKIFDRWFGPASSLSGVSGYSWTIEIDHLRFELYVFSSEKKVGLLQEYMGKQVADILVPCERISEIEKGYIVFYEHFEDPSDGSSISMIIKCLKGFYFRIDSNLEFSRARI